MKNKILIILLFSVLFFTVLEAYNSNEIYLIQIDGVIGPPIADYVVKNTDRWSNWTTYSRLCSQKY